MSFRGIDVVTADTQLGLPASRKSTGAYVAGATAIAGDPHESRHREEGREQL
jgi:hypothetical protein